MASENSADDNVSNKLYTRNEVAKHATKDDLWLIINNNVYDVTKFLNHPGGEEVLLEQAGRDSTEAFEDIGHSSDARQLMESFLIGELVKEDRTRDDIITVLPMNDGSSGFWRSWLLPIALGLLATIVYRYFVKSH